MWIRIFDILSSILITLGIFNATKHRNWWLVYLSGSIFFIITQLHNQMYFLCCMGIITSISAIRNYRRKNPEEDKSTPLIDPGNVRYRLAKIFAVEIKKNKIRAETVKWIADQYEKDYNRCLDTCKDIRQDELDIREKKSGSNKVRNK